VKSKPPATKAIYIGYGHKERKARGYEKRKRKEKSKEE